MSGWPLRIRIPGLKNEVLPMSLNFFAYFGCALFPTLAEAIAQENVDGDHMHCGNGILGGGAC